MPNLDFITTDCEDLACHTGVTFDVQCFFSDECSDIADDLTGYTCSMLIYDETEENPLDQISADMSDAASGVVSFLIPASTTTNYNVGMYKHHIELTIGTTVTRVAQGYFEVAE